MEKSIKTNGGRSCYGVEIFMLDTLVQVYRFRSREDREKWLEYAAYSAYRFEAWTAAAIIKEYGRKALAEAEEWVPPLSEEEYWSPRM